MTNEERRFKIEEINKYNQITKSSKERITMHSSLIALWLSLFAVNSKMMINEPTFLGYANMFLCSGLVASDISRIAKNVSKKIGYEKETKILLGELGLDSIEELEKESGGRTR